MPRPERGGRRNPRVTLGRVKAVSRPTPHLARIVLDAPGLAGREIGGSADHYVKLLFPPPGVVYPEPFDLQAIRAELPRDRWPRMRTYTIRTWDEAAHELTIDVVLHGDSGLAGPWASAARPGDEIRFAGPGGGYAPDPSADGHLLIGDESALPAISVALEMLPETARATVFVEVAGPEDEQELTAPPGTSLTWIHRDTSPVGDALVKAVTAAGLPTGDVQAFVHGEAAFVKELRALLVGAGLPRDRVSISGYWRQGLDEDDWQVAKRAENPA
ncbi:NADPH-dependent ferric siderophore reductase [Actinocorallia herbida]|uniref:NADPH-dependent ferric siderophore reductase n=1 Tax=Actinocorallia herbida TaxID=58109 RepID=A0A3N1CU87_9ACTN|nr:siderophore-interacting protein [Actinocorallia herbida]ROO84754.1 NADPH-dependent ferric siderophore reductase [Actinocorallia herbida]